MTAMIETIPRLIRAAASRSGDAIVDGEARLSFGELADKAHDAARALIAIGVSPGDRVAIWAPNSWEWVVAAIALQSVGAILVPLNTRFKGHEAHWILAKSRARVLFTVNGFLQSDFTALVRAAGDLPELQTIVILRGPLAPETISWSDFNARAIEIASDEAEARALAVAPGDLSDLMFTSGTTGRPKGVMCTHAQTLRTFYLWSEIIGLRERDRYLIVNPYFHTFGYKAGWLACLIRGAINYPQAVFDVNAVLRRIAHDRITMLPGPPTLYQSILNHPDRGKFDLSSLRLAVTGAAVIPVELIRRMREELSFETILTAYGLTESCGVVTMCHAGDDPETIAMTSGRALPGTEVKVVGASGVEAPRGEPGEVWARGPNVMRGYWEEPEESAAAVDGEGWLHTGDVGVMDARGNLRITDRLKDLFIVGGFNAYPAEIENLLLRNEKIAQAAVVGIPDERLGEVGVAFVVLRPGKAATESELVGWAREQMANYKAPRRVHVVDALPLNAVGKVLKYELRKRALTAAS
jgi:acyl-CoA synthetase (AMP-forming)/AMP-acid ligase II